jgi:hypothetical protein
MEEMIRPILRAAEKINYPNLLVSRLVLYVSLTGEYLDMHRLTSLEYEPGKRRLRHPAPFGTIYFFRGPNNLKNEEELYVVSKK